MACMAYVGLNPIRANMAKTPETSDYTSVKERIREHLGKPNSADTLLTMDGDNQQSTGIPFYLNDYLELLDWSGRAIRENKSGSIPIKLLPILRRLQIKPDTWINQVNHFAYMDVGKGRELGAEALVNAGIEWQALKIKSKP